MRVSTFWSLLKKTVEEWQRDKVSRLAAALAYYTTFSLAPVLVIVIAIASFLFERDTVQSRILEQTQGLLGEQGAALIQEMLTNSQSQGSGGVIATVVSVGLLILGASGVFIQLQDALNTVWNVEVKPDAGISRLVKVRLLSFGMILAIGFLLLVSLMVSTALSAVNGAVNTDLIGWDFGWQILNAVFSFGVITLLFAMIYKYLPDVKISWMDVWIGAAITALLFTIGKGLIGLYLGNSSVASTYGAAGSFVVLLLWIYYTAQIVLFGAEFTQVYANRLGSPIEPDEQAVSTSELNKANSSVPEASKFDRRAQAEHRKQRRRNLFDT